MPDAAGDLPRVRSLSVDYPSWVDDVVDWDLRLADDAAKMRLAIAVARENVVRGSGGPFGAIVVECGTGRLISVGMNSVVRLGNSALHGEIMAFMMAQARLGTYTLRGDGDADGHELFTSSEPCAMCLGATLWSGVRRLVYGAPRADAERLDFDEGPMVDGSYDYLRARGIEIVPEFLAAEARVVLELYAKRSGPIYNG